MGIKLDLATALVASVASGLSRLDDTFHCLLQFHRYRSSEPFQPSLFASYSVTGPGVLLSSSAVAVGFLALRLSEFTPFSNFGAMVAIATAGSTIGNILLLPACLTLGERLRAGPGDAIGRDQILKVATKRHQKRRLMPQMNRIHAGRFLDLRSEPGPG